jgi:DNA replication protein DnaC
MSNYQQVLHLLDGLKLKGVQAQLDEQVNQAETKSISYLSFLHSILDSEVNYRSERRLKRNFTGAHFPYVKQLRDYDFKSVKGFTRTDGENLKDLRWLDNHENLLFFGPPGIGKTHLAISFGVSAVEKGYTVCFERVTNLIKLLKTAEIQR